MSELPRIVVVCGPTASGKTGFAIGLAKALDGEIVGADSVQVYRDFDIGTAKPTADERAQIPHHLIDICNAEDPFNAAEFKIAADRAIAEILDRGRIPVVVGGTGLYLRILIKGIFQAPKPDEQLRDALKLEIEAYGVPHLYDRLKLVDPALAAKIEPHDRNRVMRGLEIFEQTGIPLSQHQRAHDFGDPSYLAFQLGMRRDRAELYRRIEARASQMWAEGLLQEYEGLLNRGFLRELKPMRSMGYRQAGRFVAGEQTKAEALADQIRETKRYAKRQLTWFRKDKSVHWVDAADPPVAAVEADARRFLAGEAPRLGWATEAP